MPDYDSQERNRDMGEALEDERNVKEVVPENGDENQDGQKIGGMGEANDDIVETKAAAEITLTGADEIEQEIRDDDAAVGALESPVEVRSENEEMDANEEELSENETVFEEESEKDTTEDQEKTDLDREADKDALEENRRSGMDLVDEARLGTGSRIALAMANADSIFDNEAENTENAVEDHNGNQVTASEEIAKLEGNYFESEGEERNGNISEAGTRVSKSNTKDGIPIVDRREEKIPTSVRSGLESVKRELESNVDNLGKVSENDRDSGLTKTVTNGNPLNGELDITGQEGNNGVASNLMGKESQGSNGNGNSNSNGVMSNLMSKASQGTKSIKTLVESPVKKFLDPTSSLEAGKNYRCSIIVL